MNTEMEISNIWGVRGGAPRENFAKNGVFFLGKNVVGSDDFHREKLPLVCEILKKTEKLNVVRLVSCFLYTFEKKHNECNEVTLCRTSKFAIDICLQNSAIL